MTRLTCRIIISGELDERFFESFAGLSQSTVAGRTELAGLVRDPAEFHGILRQLFALGLDVRAFEVESPG